MTIDSILDDLDQYVGRVDDLVANLRQVGIDSADKFNDAVREACIPVKRSFREEIISKLECAVTDTDESDWQAALVANTVETYRQYLDEHPDGAHCADAGQLITLLGGNPAVSARTGEDELIWQSINRADVASVQNFIAAWPDSPHISEAQELYRDLIVNGVGIQALERQMNSIRTDKSINSPEDVIYSKIVDFLTSGRISKDEFVYALAEDHNFISGTVANKLWENNMLKVEDFTNAGISDDFISHMMSNIPLQTFPTPAKIEKITKCPCTEVYFWGIPSSGKSCALGAILSAAKSGKVANSMLQDPDCQGYGYMTRLSNLFRGDGRVGTLPQGTSISSTYEMGFILSDRRRAHLLTCVDLAGELIRCMYKQDAGEELTDEEQDVLAALRTMMIDKRTENRKIHYFVLEYGAENREYEGLPQRDYLDAALAYINRTGIFRRDTDAVFLLITKVDKAKAGGEELTRKLRDYIKENYLGFYNGLLQICQLNEINNGEIEIQPFSLGEVCFQYYCRFDDSYAMKVVQTLLQRSYTVDISRLGRIMSGFRR